MKILFISMSSIHAIRWIENLMGSEHELYWFDVLSKGNLNTSICITQLTNWKERKIPYIKGEHFVRKRFPIVYEKIHSALEITANNYLVQILEKVQPDVVHSFEMQSCCYPILRTMNKFQNIPWIYSSWGSDLFYYQNFNQHNKKIRQVLQRVNFLQTDCTRDVSIAANLGFKGCSLDVIPGGGGYKVDEIKELKESPATRKVILIKGYEHNFGRALYVIRAIEKLTDILINHEIVVFGAHCRVKNYIIEKNLNIRVFDRNELNQQQVIELMGKSLIYIGNSTSDGMPNTLLESIVMGAFPIQSNPGNVTKEIITHGVNGFLIDNPADIEEIVRHITSAISNIQMIDNALKINSRIADERLDYYLNRDLINKIYSEITQKSCD